MEFWTRGEKLGEGSFGFVSIARSTSRHQQASGLPALMAVKSAKESDSKSLSKEKDLLDKFKGCSSILRCFREDYTTENGQQLYNILLEYASGGCLIDRITTAKVGERKALPEKMVSRYTKSILTALSHIHKLGYVHCDVKPHNILLFKQTNEDGDYWEEEAKLADFGSCVRFADEGNNGDFRGTVLYAAPESISRQIYVPESDVWSLGCTVLHMLTGNSPWTFDKKVTAEDVLFKIGCSDAIPEIPTTKKISKDAQDFLKRCFVKDPTARWTADMLLNHPFIKNHNRHHRRRHHHGHLSSRFSHGIHSLVPHCFHVPKSATVHAC
ncbi:hypothetical protein ACP275_02G130900 [Erythranthe tilingii]